MQDADIQTWLMERLPAELAAAPPQIRMYDDELVVVLQSAAPDQAAGTDESEREQRLIGRLREASRPLRMQLARELQHLLKMPVAWGMRCGTTETIFTSRTVPVMTRLNRREREVLDTLVAAGVAETRSAALAYAVRAFAEAHSEWIAEVGVAIEQVQQVRSKLKLRRGTGAPPLDPQPASADEQDE